MGEYADEWAAKGDPMYGASSQRSSNYRVKEELLVLFTEHFKEEHLPRRLLHLKDYS